MSFQSIVYELGFEKETVKYCDNKPYLDCYINDKKSYYQICIWKPRTRKYYQIHCRIKTYVYSNESDMLFHISRIKDELKTLQEIKQKLKEKGYLSVEEKD